MLSHSQIPAARANGEGDPCPPWCVIDHRRWSFHASESATVEAPRYYPNTVRAIRYPTDNAPEVQVLAKGVITVRTGEAGNLADIIEHLADATPEEHRQLADAIREAAAVIIDGDSQ